MQLEIGSVATPLEKRDPELELRQCQRFYQVGAYSAVGYSTAGFNIGSSYPFATSMRAAPVVVTGSAIGGDTNVSTGATDLSWVWGFRFYFTLTATGYGAGVRNFTASADL